MTESQILLASAALLIAATMLPVSSGVRAVLFMLILSFMVLSGIGSALSHLPSAFG